MVNNLLNIKCILIEYTKYKNKSYFQKLQCNYLIHKIIFTFCDGVFYNHISLCSLKPLIALLSFSFLTFFNIIFFLINSSFPLIFRTCDFLHASPQFLPCLLFLDHLEKCTTDILYMHIKKYISYVYYAKYD